METVSFYKYKKYFWQNCQRWGDRVSMLPRRRMILDFHLSTDYNESQLNSTRGRVFMKIISQLGIIFGIYWASQIIEAFLPFSFPASVIGILLLLALLVPGILKAESIREAADFLTGNFTFFLLPVCSSIINYVDLIGANLVPFFVICTVSTFVTFFVVYFTVRQVTRMMNKKGGEEA